MSKFDQAKMLMKLKKMQKELQKMTIEVEKGDGAVRVEITGEQKIKKVHIDPDYVDLDDIGQLERWVEDAVKEAIQESQKIAAEKMQPMMGALGNLGLQQRSEMQVLPPALTELIEALGALPGVGPRTAERYAYYLLKADRAVGARISEASATIHDKVSYCKKTFALIEAGKELSDLYTDPSRNKQLVAVVTEPFDILALEKTGQYNGTKHVFGGLV